MMQIPCPFCGNRSQIEFTYGGDATAQRPDEDATTSPADWLEYVYFRDNPCGNHIEYWHHSAGCRQWFSLRRDTRSHEIQREVEPG